MRPSYGSLAKSLERAVATPNVCLVAASPEMATVSV